MIERPPEPGTPVAAAIGVLPLLLVLAACAAPLKPAAFETTIPAFDPVTFWTGHATSWGVIENRGGGPTAIVTTDCNGTPDGAGGLHMIQTVTTDGKITHRDWHMRRLDPTHFSATANDMDGEAHGIASGRTFRWTWVWDRPAGLSVTMQQWMYLADDGTLMNRTIVTKLGVRLAEVSEQFVRR